MISRRSFFGMIAAGLALVGVKPRAMGASDDWWDYRDHREEVVWRDGDVVPEHLQGLLQERMILAGIPLGTVITAAHANQFIPKRGTVT